MAGLPAAQAREHQNPLLSLGNKPHPPREVDALASASRFIFSRIFAVEFISTGLATPQIIVD